VPRSSPFRATPYRNELGEIIETNTGTCHLNGKRTRAHKRSPQQGENARNRRLQGGSAKKGGRKGEEQRGKRWANPEKGRRGKYSQRKYRYFSDLEFRRMKIGRSRPCSRASNGSIAKTPRKTYSLAKKIFKGIKR